MQTLYFPTVIVGSGFAGRTVASHLEAGSFMIVERGENREFSESLRRYEDLTKNGMSDLKAQEHSYSSDLHWNTVPRLSEWCYSRYALIRGGASNWWGGKATRFSEETFGRSDVISWPFTSQEMAKWYRVAERTLNISGDPLNAEAPTEATIPGAEYWRSAFSPHLSNSNLYNTAINNSQKSKTKQGSCKGRGRCAICHEDAKARPDNIFDDHATMYETMALSIDFQGSKATSIECFDGKQVFRIGFDRLVIACNGIESPRLLARSDLPEGVRRDYIGKFLQDHAHLEISCKMSKPLLYGNVGGLSHVPVKEISGIYQTSKGKIDTSALALTHQPRPETIKKAMDLNVLRSDGTIAFVRNFSGAFDIFCELEIPASSGIEVDLDSDEPKIIDGAYKDLIPAFDEISNEMVLRLTRLGVEVTGINRIYRTGYGGHHFVGTTNCSSGDRAVVDENFQLIGSENVFLAGASVIPIEGGVAPTLTLVALAEKLGSYLKSN